MRQTILISSAALLVLSACSQSEQTQSGEALQSDLPLRSVEYLMSHAEDAAAVQAMCSNWKNSQRPVTSWPSVVTENCSNKDTVRMLKIEDERRQKLKRQAGI